MGLQWRSLEMLFWQGLLLLALLYGVFAFENAGFLSERSRAWADIYEIIPYGIELWLLAIFSSVYVK